MAVRQVDDHEDHQLTLENYLIRIISILVLCAATLYAQTPAKRENKQAADAKQSAETPSTPPVKPDSAAKSSAPPVVNGKPIPRDLALFTEEMDNDLDGYIRAEITKKKLPIRVVLNFEDADLEMTGSSTPEEKRKWHSGWLTPEQDRTAGNVMVVHKASGQMLWAGEAGDRSIWWGAMARGGQRKVAGRIVGSLKDAIQ